MRHLHALLASLVLMAAAAAGPIAANAQAQPGPQTSGGAADPVASPAKAPDSLTTGSVSLSPAEMRKKRLEDCMAIWEPATHMTKKQWLRTCNSQLDEEPNP